MVEAVKAKALDLYTKKKLFAKQRKFCLPKNIGQSLFICLFAF